MSNIWKVIKREFVKTFIRGEKIEKNPFFITYHTHDPSRWELLINHAKNWIKENSVFIHVLLAVFSLMVAVIALFK